jgi:hypothetical protein
MLYRYWLEISGLKIGPILTFILWIPLSIGLLALTVPLKRVRLDKDFLYVSNYFKEIKVPLSQIKKIETVDGAHYFNPRWVSVIVILKQQSEFGKVIEFVPKFTLNNHFQNWKRQFQPYTPRFSSSLDQVANEIRLAKREATKQ